MTLRDPPEVDGKLSGEITAAHAALETAHSEIAAAHAAVETAQARLRRAITKAFPVGAHVLVTLGGHLVHGEVTGYGPDWSDLSVSDVYIRNVETGKSRRFSATYHEAKVYR